MGDQKTDPLIGDKSPDAEQGENDAQREYAKMGGVTDVEAEARRTEERTTEERTTTTEK